MLLIVYGDLCLSYADASNPVVTQYSYANMDQIMLSFSDMSLSCLNYFRKLELTLKCTRSAVHSPQIGW